MTPLQMLDECTSGPWVTAGLDVQYKIVDGRLSFQHSVSASDWMHNFFAVPTVAPLQCCERVHAGFLNLIVSVLPEIEPHADKIHTVVGFSQGGALAQLYAMFYGVRCISFASPKVVFLPKRHYPLIHRFERRGDIVPIIPFGYTGIGSIQKIGHFSWPSVDNHFIEAYRSALSC